MYREQLMKIYFVYILKCSDGTYYTGMTSNLSNRILEHKNGKYKKSYTFKRRPVQLVFYSEFEYVYNAIETEKQIKKWSQAKKEALINEESDKLPNLAKKNFHKK